MQTSSVAEKDEEVPELNVDEILRKDTGNMPLTESNVNLSGKTLLPPLELLYLHPLKFLLQLLLLLTHLQQILVYCSV